MITFQKIQQISERKSINPETIEKDYCLTWFLIGMTKSVLSKILTFYGGTSIHKAYYASHRYSEDLDFTTENQINIKDTLSELSGIFNYIQNKCNLIFQLDQESLSVQNDRYLFLARYDGFSELAHEKTLRVDISTNNIFPLAPVSRQLVLDYPDMQNVKAELQCYTLESIVVEKIGAIFEGIRREPRDLYDLWFIAKNGNIKMSQIKVGYKRKFGVAPSIVLKNLTEKFRHPSFANLWGNKLRYQVPELPDIETVIRETVEFLSRH